MSELLDADAVAAALADLEGWEGDQTALGKEYRFNDFVAAMEFTNAVADLAEEANHHPDIAISYNRVRLSIRSHSAGGVTPQCVRLAQRIDDAAGA